MLLIECSTGTNLNTNKMDNIKTFGFYLNGETLIKQVKCGNPKAAKGKLDFMYPQNFNIQIKEIKPCNQPKV